MATGTPIALIEEAGTAAADAGAAVPPRAATVATDPSPRRTTGGALTRKTARAALARVLSLVRRLAEEHHVRAEELETIEGTGTGGRVTKDDVLRYLDTRGGTATVPEGAPGEPGLAGGPFATPAARPAAAAGADRLQPLSVLRRAIADRMTRSAREIPHAFGSVEVDMTAIVRHREAHKAAWRARDGVNVTLTAFVVRAATRALRAHPLVNSTFTPEGIVLKHAINFGVGVAVPDGLIVPVIKDADRRSVVGIAREVDALASRARQGTLAPDDIVGGTFTLTNAGVYGSIVSIPLINYPQAAILTTDAVVRRPVVVGDGITIREIMHIGLSFDHRIFDGALALEFLGFIRRQLEEFVPAGDSPEF